MSGMAGADIVVGGVDDLGSTYASDYWSSRRSKPDIDVSNDLLTVAGSRTGSELRLAFTRLRDTGDLEGDRPVSAGVSHIIWSLGSSNALEYHSSRGFQNLELCGPSTSQDSTTSTTATTTSTTTTTAVEPTSGNEVGSLLPRSMYDESFAVPLLRINSGGKSFVDANGNSWSKDDGASEVRPQFQGAKHSTSVREKRGRLTTQYRARRIRRCTRIIVMRSWMKP